MTDQKKEELENKLREEYPNGTDLIYIDRNDSLDERHDYMEELAQTGEMVSFWENYDDWGEWEAKQEIFKQVFTEEEMELINEDEDLKCSLEDYLREKDTSDPLKDLLKNTPRRFFFYDLGEIDLSDSKYNKAAYNVARKLKIDYRQNKDKIITMLQNSFDGGNLVVFFAAEPFDLQKTIGKENTIIFKEGFEVLIMNRSTGSGTAGDGFIPSEPITLPFTRENLHDDKGCAGYSYGYDVCGMSTWDTASWDISYKINQKKVKGDNQLKIFAEREKRYNETFKQGTCTPLDMDLRRHRHVEYINDFPCGSKCKICGTFWVD
jgi:hypothetical protein